jgi:aspartyl-tRNA synthetase
MKRILIEDTTSFVGESVKISGFVNSVRAHGNVLFFDIRDHSSLLQTVIISSSKDYDLAKKIRPEWVIEVIGKIKERPEKMRNKEMKTGEIEMEIEEIVVLSEAETAPFSIQSDGYEINEELRMKYRYLDLRRERLQKNIKLRHQVILFFRNFLTKEGFTEIETPILTKSTPEGARDFLVPSRLQPKSFYALPQSPQQYKQLLMVAGFEKYFQVARCFRDEDSRADRQAEFTQIDMELSFVKREDVMSLIEKMVKDLVKNLFPEKKIKEDPFPVLLYKDVMEKYGTDRPDIRTNKEDENELAFAFVVDFPMFEKNEEGKWNAVHHPFTMPDSDDAEEIKNNPTKIKGLQYDLVLNGNEIAGGSIRCHKKEILETVFEVLGHKKEDIEKNFGHLFSAFSYGVPPHGGVAFGLERFLMVLTGEKNIREVIAFPKTGDGRELTMGTPSPDIEKKQLDELNIKIKE